MKSLLEIHDREETIERLKVLYDRGYRYVVRGPESELLTVFSLKPKKYFKEFVGWGYKTIDLDNPDARYADFFQKYRYDRNKLDESLSNVDIRFN